MPRRGATLVEVALAMALTAMLMGALVLLYGFAAVRASDAMARATVLFQERQRSDDIRAVITMAVSCSAVTVGSQTALKCTLPSTCTDTDGDGYPDQCTPTGIGRRGTDKWGTGQRVWFYLSDTTGDPMRSGTVVWRAKRTDDSNPTSSDADSKWALYYGGTSRSSLLTSLAFAVSSSAQTVTQSLNSASLTRDQRTPGGSDSASQQDSLLMSRTIYWRNWRK